MSLTPKFFPPKFAALPCMFLKKGVPGRQLLAGKQNVAQLGSRFTQFQTTELASQRPPIDPQISASQNSEPWALTACYTEEGGFKVGTEPANPSLRGTIDPELPWREND